MIKDTDRPDGNDIMANEYSTTGCYEVWRSWRDMMIEQGREVKEELMSLPIPDRDLRLDARIAHEVVYDFLVWVRAHHGMELQPTRSKVELPDWEQKTECAIACAEMALDQATDAMGWLVFDDPQGLVGLGCQYLIASAEVLEQTAKQLRERAAQESNDLERTRHAQ